MHISCVLNITKLVAKIIPFNYYFMYKKQKLILSDSIEIHENNDSVGGSS